MKNCTRGGGGGGEKTKGVAAAAISRPAPRPPLSLLLTPAPLPKSNPPKHHPQTNKTPRQQGPKGELTVSLVPEVSVAVEEGGGLLVRRLADSKRGAAMHGLSRSITANIVQGVSEGFERRMEMVGTGYRASATATELTLNVGYSKPRILPVPAGVTVAVEKGTGLVFTCADKVVLGDFCARVRRQRPPEPYKGKGIRYAGEVIKLKEGKSGKKK
jgi:large subunit ribosomal protein L6